MDRVSVGRGGRNTEKDISRSPPGCLLGAMVSRAPLPGSVDFMGGVSVGYSHGTAGGADVAQLLGRGPLLSPVSGHLRFLSSRSEV